MLKQIIKKLFRGCDHEWIVSREHNWTKWFKGEYRWYKFCVTCDFETGTLEDDNEAIPCLFHKICKKCVKFKVVRS